jgi:hypothetical protein
MTLKDVEDPERLGYSALVFSPKILPLLASLPFPLRCSLLPTPCKGTQSHRLWHIRLLLLRRFLGRGRDGNPVTLERTSLGGVNTSSLKLQELEGISSRSWIDLRDDISL